MAHDHGHGPQKCGHKHDHAAAHSHEHDDHNGRGHSHLPKDFNRAFAIGVSLNIVFVIIEVVFGWFSNSLALIADAGHNLGDVLGLLLAWGASRLALHRPSSKFTYGLRSTSILAALFNSVLLMLAVGGILWEAAERLRDPSTIHAPTVMWVAGIGIVINGLTAWMFVSGSKDDLNIRGAFTHMAADALVSLGVVISAAILMATGWGWIDPLVSILVSLVIVLGTWTLLRDSLNLALDAVPDGIETDRIAGYLKSLDGVSEIHDLHIWGMSTTENAMTAHLVMPAGHPGDTFLTETARGLERKFRIHHTTIQIEIGDGKERCALESGEVV